LILFFEKGHYFRIPDCRPLTPPPPDTPETIGFLLLPKFSMMAFVAALEPLRVANRLAQRTLYRWEIVSTDGAPVAASSNLTLLADRAMEAAPRYDKLVISASFEPEAAYDRATAAWLKRQDRAGTALGAIDTGSFLLAWAGLLDGYRATTHWECLDSFAEQFPKVDVGAGLFIIDRTRFTCAGGTAALDMMLHLIRLRHGQQLAAAVSDQFIHAKIRDSQERQRMVPEAREGISRPGFARAIDLMETHLEEVLSIDALCAAAGVSRRQLERMFQRHFRLSPQRYYLDLRLQRARALLQYTDLSVIEITVACGFGAAAHFSRAYRAWSGRPPTAERAARAREIIPSLR
jgi:AraC family carnitine catabolism transcriptional activator